MQQLFLSRKPKISVNNFYNGLHGNAPPKSSTNISGFRYIKKWGFHELSRCEKVGKPCWIDHKGLIKWQEDLHCSFGRCVKEHHFSLVSRFTKLTLNSLLQEEGDVTLPSGSTISGWLKTQRRRWKQRERQKSNRFILPKQQLCTCITLFCIFLTRCCTTATWIFVFTIFMEDVNITQQFSFS